MNRLTQRLRLLLFGLMLCMALPATAFDHGHAAWDALLERHVAWQPGGHESQAAYAGFKQERSALNAYLAALSAVTEPQFKGWTKPQQLAFLINAYNAYTVDLILTRYPELDSIRDLGSLLNSPWKKRFIVLLGRPRSLDDIEHGMVRARGVYDDPRIHMAVNCASIGCPALRPEAYVAERLDAQLDDQVARFMSDRTRNRFDTTSRRLQVSRIFDWYGDDFRRGHRGIDSVEGFLARYAAVLADRAEDQQAVRERKAKLSFLEYDWALNDRR
jgi:hypothetical protein